LTEEYLKAVQVMGLTLEELQQLVDHAIHAALLSQEKKAALTAEFLKENERLAAVHL
jgi:adenosine deaminase